ncbi:MAG TPA: SRPBCC family protein [Niabella sp.]|nr:SRPBCC family protein [Niabella sp.]
MKIVKRILFVILGLIALLLIVAIFVPKDYAITKEVVINKPVAEVFNYVKYLKNQDNYSKWNQIDRGMKKVYTGTDGTVGFIYAWDSKNKNAGKGAQEIKAIDENKRVDIEIRFEKPMEGTNTASVITTPLDSTKTKVEWGFYGTASYPFNLMNLCMNALVGGDLQTNLDNLKKVLEK